MYGNTLGVFQPAQIDSWSREDDGTLKGGMDIAFKLGVEISEHVYCVKWIKHHGTEYGPVFIICTEVACEMPVFCKINTIAVKDENVRLCGTLMETLCFDDHYHAFTVRSHPSRIYS